jgi:NADPH:quinone reductase-like Zn-dependent oxidoreductase
MKAVVFERYGPPDVLRIVDLPQPQVPEDGVLVRVRASSVNIAEWYGMTGLFVARLGNGLLRPRDTRLGGDFAGIVEAVGPAVADFKPGDEVFGGRSGAYAEYVAVRKAIALKPGNVSFEEAAAVPTAGITALQGLRDHGQVQPGQKVLINGASGGVGSFAIQVAKALGAEVTAVCSTQNVASARALGADHVVDYTRQDFTRGGERYDLLFDIAGSRPWRQVQRVLRPNAQVIIVGGPRTPLIGPLSHVLRMRLGALGSGRQVKFFVAQFTREDMQTLADLLVSGQVEPLVERCYPLAQIADAMRLLGAGHARGKIVVTLPAAGGG